MMCYSRITFFTFVLLILGIHSEDIGSNMISVGRVGELRVALDVSELKPLSVGDRGAPDRGPIWIVACDEDKSALAGNSQRIWVIRYSAWKAGEYDLRDLLAWPTGFNKEQAKAMPVTVIDPLPTSHQGQLAKAPPESLNVPLPLPNTWRWLVGGLWAVGLVGFAWLAWLGKDGSTGAHGLNGDPERRKLLEGLKTAGRTMLTPQTRAALQRQFLALLLNDFAVEHGTFQEKLKQVQAHVEGGPLMEQFDKWLESLALQPDSPPEGIIQYLEKNSSGKGRG